MSMAAWFDTDMDGFRGWARPGRPVGLPFSEATPGVSFREGPFSELRRI
jgi:hypothetical protein